MLPGQFWFDPTNKNLYVYTEGEWVLASDGSINAGAFQTTLTVPLGNTDHVFQLLVITKVALLTYLISMYRQTIISGHFNH